jgi:acyl-CoA synthetase (AMP-forming)/AMP-acid ligase II/acyl carrier protein
MITHANVTRLFAATRDWFRFDELDTWTLFHTYAFDFSVWELWGALLFGGRLVVVPFLTSRSAEVFCELLSREHVTVLNQTPSAFHQLIWAESTLGPDPHLPLRLVIFGGEALDLNTLLPWVERHPLSPRLVNMYGITETTVHVTYRPLDGSDLDLPRGSPIGRPIPDLQLYVLDPYLHPAPIGVPGELFVGGDGLARGYLHRPSLTALRFVPNPFSDRPGARLYRTGDLARFLDDGDVEYLGRVDFQVKIRGHRVELGEIEAALTALPTVRESVVLARDDGAPQEQPDGPAGTSASGTSLVAYVVAGDGERPTEGELRAALQQRLPAYMLPSAFCFLDALPLTPNGKVDRRALPEPEGTRPELQTAFVAPRTPTEKILASIWARVLDLEQVGIHDNFFDLGGHSLLVTLATSRIRKEFAIEVPLRALFDRPTVAALANYVEAVQWAAQAPQPATAGSGREEGEL